MHSSSMLSKLGKAAGLDTLLSHFSSCSTASQVSKREMKIRGGSGMSSEPLKNYDIMVVGMSGMGKSTR